VGPSADGRIKPDVMAPGVDIWSAGIAGNCSVDSQTGTSAAVAIAASAAALIRDYFERGKDGFLFVLSSWIWFHGLLQADPRRFPLFWYSHSEAISLQRGSQTV
jgi:subtilisin family serine protease